MQHEIRTPQRLLDRAGNIAEPGYARRLLWQYAREDIRAPRWRIKEWDYYYIGCQDYGLALTISDAGYVSSLSVSLLTYGEKPEQWNDGAMGALPLGKLQLPATSTEGNLCARVGKADMRFLNDGKRRVLQGSFERFAGSGKMLSFDITLSQIPEESMVIATPFPKPAHFYYNQKINCMAADGVVRFDGREYLFRSEDGAMGTLDWGRGVWTYDNAWYWGSGQMLLESGDRFGFNIGYGFGDTSAASENMLFWNGTAQKLEVVDFRIPRKPDGSYDYMKPWTFTESSGRFEMRMQPVIDRQAPVNLGVVCMIPHQVFGRMSGTAVLDDGSDVRIQDRMVFAEHVHNRW
ncbi:MAG: DUF2804 domain-containing protein [Oscillospiraceae bacterium]|nr:DUF2804 domain-containing protein [Oscillospiraceae bacterium]